MRRWIDGLTLLGVMRLLWSGLGTVDVDVVRVIAFVLLMLLALVAAAWGMRR
jgi:hypothetical protein